MRATLTTLKSFVILAGLLGLLSSDGWLAGSGDVASFVAGVGFVVGCAYVYIGIRLHTLLRTAPRQVTGVLQAGGVFLLAVLAMNLVGAGTLSAISAAAGGLAITWYLLENAKRLVRELQRGQAEVVSDAE